MQQLPVPQCPTAVSLSSTYLCRSFFLQPFWFSCMMLIITPVGIFLYPYVSFCFSLGDLGLSRFVFVPGTIYIFHCLFCLGQVWLVMSYPSHGCHHRSCSCLHRRMKNMGVLMSLSSMNGLIWRQYAGKIVRAFLVPRKQKVNKEMGSPCSVCYLIAVSKKSSKMPVPARTRFWTLCLFWEVVFHPYLGILSAIEISMF